MAWRLTRIHPLGVKRKMCFNLPMADFPASPVVNQRLLCRDLRNLRIATGRSAADVAGALGWSESRVTRLETTSQAPRPASVAALLDELGVQGQRRDRVIGLANRARVQGWWHPFRGSLSAAFLTYIGFEDAADLIHTYEQDSIPGLLQTEDYTRALIAARHPRLDSETVDQLVAVRTTRQKRLEHSAVPVRLWAILGEAALRYQVGGPNVMRTQLEHLLAMAQTRHVTLSISRFDQGAPLAKGPFAILTFVEDIPEVAYLESVGDDQWVEDDDEVAGYRETWERMLIAGTKYDATLEAIKEAISALT